MGALTNGGRNFATLAERVRVLLHPSRAAAARGAAAPAGIDLPALFASAEVERDWQAVAARIAHLGLTPESGMNPGDRRALYYLVRHLRPASVLEIGTQAGASTVYLAAGLADVHGVAGGRRLLTVDIRDVNQADDAAWRSFGLRQPPAEAMRMLGYEGLVGFRVGRSLDVLRETEERYDLIFLDGDHRLRTTVAEIPLAFARLRPGGLLLLHDFFPGLRPLWPDRKVIEGPQLAVQRLRCAGWPIEAAPLGDLPWPTKLGTSRTSLALLGRASLSP
jgi:predicted O-methyltransferase YrrM